MILWEWVKRMVEDFRRGPVRKPRTDYLREWERAQQGVYSGLANRGYFPVPLWIDAANQSYLSPLIGHGVPDLYLVRISAFHSDEAATSGNTVLEVAAHTGGPPTVLGTLTLLNGPAGFQLVTAEFKVAVDPLSLIIFARQTDGGHRQVFATAYFAQIPTR